jgi:hypothetical protein
MKITSDLTNLTTAILILTVHMFIELAFIFLHFSQPVPISTVVMRLALSQ